MKKMTSKILLSVLVMMGALVSPSVVAQGGCQNANIIGGRLITDICWDCVFPIMLAGTRMDSGSETVPADAVTTPLCLCQDDLGVSHPGITTSMWEPARLIEFQRLPGCSSVLNGTQFPMNQLNVGHHARGGKEGLQESFLHYHYYSFPLLTMLEMFTNAGCNADGYVDLDLMYMSELDPTWNDSELAFFTNVESVAVANPEAAIACVADAASSNSGHPIDSMFWCAGSWGQIYPFVGMTYNMHGIVENTSLLKMKVLAALHRRGVAHRTMGDDAMCEGRIDHIVKKSMYKFTVLHPVAETDRAHVSGESIMRWGGGRVIPSVGEDLIYTIWRWNDCCNIRGD